MLYNCGVCILWHLMSTGFFDSGKLPQRNYLINFSLLLTLVLQITTAVIYQSLSTSISNSQKLGVDLTQSLSLNVYFWYYFVFIVLKMTSPLLCPIHWLAISGILPFLHIYSGT